MDGLNLTDNAMRQTYYCPQCGYLLAYADRFCSHCGTCLKWVILQDTPDDEPAQQPAHAAGACAPASEAASGGSVSPLRSDISRLLTGFFEKRYGQDKVSQTR
jgi:hypothetical protein